MFGNVAEDRLTVRPQPKWDLVALGTRRRVARPTAAQIGFVNVRHADIEPFGDLTGWLARVECRHDLGSQIL